MTERKKSGFLASTLTLAAGSTGAQIITLALMPVITRLYSPEAFGVFAVFVALAAVLISVSNLQFAEVIVIAPSSRDADAAALFSALIVLGLSIMLALLTLVFSEPLAALLGIPEYSYFLPILSLALFLGGLRQIMRRWLLREHQNRYIATAEVVNAITDRSATIGLFWLAPGTPVGLVVGRLVGQVFTLLAMLKPFFGRPLQIGSDKAQREHLVEVARQYSHFPRYSWAILLDNAAQQLPVIMISTLLSPAIAGGFALARRVLAEPAILLGASVAQSFYQQAARAESREYLGTLTLRLTLVLSKLIALPVVIALVAAPELFALVFGEQWRESGWYALLLSPVFMLYFLLRPLNRIFDVTQKQREKGVYATQNLVLIVIALLPAYFIKDALFVLAVYACLSTLFLTYRCAWLLAAVGVSRREFVSRFVVNLVIALLCVALLLSARFLLGLQGLPMILASALATLLYLLCNLMDRDFAQALSSVRDLRKR